MSRLVSALAAGALGTARLVAQTAWVPPQPPCDIKPGHFRVSSAPNYLKIAAEQPAQRDRMLRQTQDVLARAIIGDKQDKNPAAWYYLGRYYVETNDAAGADSAFAKAEALAPQCKQDIAGYRERLWGSVVNEGLRTWQEAKNDSAVMLLGLAYSLVPANPKPLFSLGQLYAAGDQTDSAVVYLRKAADVAARDTSLADSRRDALGTIARLELHRTRTDPAIQRWQRTHYSRDSLLRAAANDSIVLARIQASSASRRARGARLAPADQQSFSRDSTARAQSLTQDRTALAGIAQRTAADSAAAQPRLEPALRGFREYLMSYPEVVEAVTAFAGLYAETGRVREGEAVLDSIYGSGRRLDADIVLDAGQRIVRANLPAAGTRVLAAGLEKNPYHRDALAALANGYLALRDGAHLLPVARRLVEVEPLDRTSLRLLAAAWDLSGGADSARKYRSLADSGLQVEVTVGTFLPDSGEVGGGHTLSGMAANAGNQPSSPFRLVFEFLDRAGAVRLSQPVDMPSIPALSNHLIEVHAAGEGIVAWRYRRS